MKNKRKRDHEADPVIDIVERGANKFLVLHAAEGIPCYSACCFSPCSTKPQGLEPCVCYKNKYHKNIYYRSINSAKSIEELRELFEMGMPLAFDENEETSI